jgi:YihY family inner membrane protein
METIGIQKSAAVAAAATTESTPATQSPDAAPGKDAESAPPGSSDSDPKKKVVVRSKNGVEYQVTPESSLARLPRQLQEPVVRIFLYVDRTDFSKLGLIGSLLLIWTVIKVMGRVENTFNTIWGVRKGRSLHRKFSDYISVLVVVPFLILVAASLPPLLSTGYFVKIMQAHLGPVYWVYIRMIRFAGLTIIGIGFSLLYAFMPNTQVRVFPALTGGFVGGGLWYVLQLFYINGQISLARYNAIYGTFAAIPIFLFWLYLSWVVVLLGAEVSFAVQNYATYVLERTAEDVPYASREMLGFVIMQELCRHFIAHGGPWSTTEFARANGIPIRLMLHVMHVLTGAGLAVGAADMDAFYLPGRDPAKIGLNDVERAFRGKLDPVTLQTARTHAKSLYPVLARYRAEYEKAMAGRSFAEFAN